jgi:polyhydroxybutyrate depolymerase
MRKFAVVAIVAAIAAIAGVTAGGDALAVTGKAGSQAAITEKTYSMKVGGMTRSWEVIAPGKALPKGAPIIVMLSGIGATVAEEIVRDQLTPYAATDKAELVYPVAYKLSWNAIGCCGLAGTDKVNDLAFLRALAPRLDPGHKRPIDVVGYSNGARLAYRVACTQPKLFDAYAMVKGGPMPGCVVRTPADIEQLASTDDIEVPYQTAGKGSEKLSALQIAAELRSADKCSGNSTVTRAGNLTLYIWSRCSTGKRAGLAVWKGGKHSFPRPPASHPGAAPVIYAFLTKTRLAPLP